VRLGFTGTQRGMTALQLMALEAWLGQRAHTFVEAHHGDCIGADSEFDAMLDSLNIDTVIHPPNVEAKRAHCCASRYGRGIGWMPPKPYLVRNHEIVDATNVLYAAPGETAEQLRSGTWATVRYARKLKRAIRFFWPDGSTTVDRQRGAP
jgi:hypothetical protein